MPGLPDIEDQIQFAQAMEALSDLCHHLQMRTMASKFKNRNASSQWAYMQLRALHNQIGSRIQASQSQYNTARAAVLSLHGPGDWE